MFSIGTREVFIAVKYETGELWKWKNAEFGMWKRVALEAGNCGGRELWKRRVV